MARSEAASGQLGRAPRGDRGPIAAQLPGLKIVLFAVVLLSLVGFVALALTRELSGPGQSAAARSEAARPAVPTPRPALTAAEEGYAQALWPIHNEVKASALKMSMAGIQYLTQDRDLATLVAVVEASIETYRRAEGQILALQPPPSLQGFHDDYLRAVRLYQQSGDEMIKIHQGRNEEHLVAAFPMSQEGGRILRRVGSTLWPGEYVPN